MSPRRKAAVRHKPLQNCAPVFAALGDEMRLRLIAALCVGGAMSITQLTSGTEISRQAVTKHLEVLAAAGLVRDVKVGRERLWEFEPAQLDEARRTLEADRPAMGPCAREAEVRRGEQLAVADRGPIAALQNAANSYIIRAHFRFGLLGYPSIGLKDYVWRCNLLIYKAPVAQPDRAPAF